MDRSPVCLTLTSYIFLLFYWHTQWRSHCSWCFNFSLKLCKLLNCGQCDQSRTSTSNRVDAKKIKSRCHSVVWHWKVSNQDGWCETYLKGIREVVFFFMDLLLEERKANEPWPLMHAILFLLFPVWIFPPCLQSSECLIFTAFFCHTSAADTHGFKGQSINLHTIPSLCRAVYIFQKINPILYRAVVSGCVPVSAFSPRLKVPN